MAAEMRPLRHFCLRKLKSLFGVSHDAHTPYEDMDQILKEHQIEWKWPDRIIREQRLEFFIKQIRKQTIGDILWPADGVRRKRGGIQRRMIDAIQDDIQTLEIDLKVDDGTKMQDFDFRRINLTPSETTLKAKRVLLYCLTFQTQILHALGKGPNETLESYNRG